MQPRRCLAPEGHHCDVDVVDVEVVDVPLDAVELVEDNPPPNTACRPAMTVLPSEGPVCVPFALVGGEGGGDCCVEVAPCAVEIEPRPCEAPVPLCPEAPVVLFDGPGCALCVEEPTLLDIEAELELALVPVEDPLLEDAALLPPVGQFPADAEF